MPTLRLDYREPAANQYCTEDVLAGLGFLANRLTASKFVVCGWSFGSAPALTAAAKDERIKGVALVAPQTAETSGIRRLAPRSLLLIHGTGDKVLSANCSRQLYEAYGEHSQGDRTLKLFDRDDHALSRNALDVEGVMFEFVARVLGKGELAKNAADGARQELIGDKKKRIEVMKQGHDLEGESL